MFIFFFQEDSHNLNRCTRPSRMPTALVGFLPWDKFLNKIFHEMLTSLFNRESLIIRWSSFSYSSSFTVISDIQLWFQVICHPCLFRRQLALRIQMCSFSFFFFWVVSALKETWYLKISINRWKFPSFCFMQDQLELERKIC